MRNKVSHAIDVSLSDLQLYIVDCMQYKREMNIALVMELLDDIVDYTTPHLHPLHRVNPQELLTSIVQDAVTRDIVDICDYIKIKDALAELDFALNKTIKFTNPHLRESLWVNMVVSLASKMTCKSEFCG